MWHPRLWLLGGGLVTDCAHATILVSQHFNGQPQPVYTRDCKGCGLNLLDQRNSKPTPNKSKRLEPA